MDAKDILKAVLDQCGNVTITETDIKASAEKKVGLVETWDDKGNKTFTVYAHEKPNKGEKK